MSDIIERAEAAINDVWAAGNRAIFTDLVAELKAARAENKQLRYLLQVHETTRKRHP